MYKSPIEITSTDDIALQISQSIDGLIYKAVINTGVSVDAPELIKALNYDRGQYEAGYKDGYIEGFNNALDQFLEIYQDKLKEALKEVKI